MGMRTYRSPEYGELYSEKKACGRLRGFEKSSV